MAAVSVFVDDAVRGSLPGVCAGTGRPSDMTLRLTQATGGVNPVLWLLVFLGPPGWIALAAVYAFGPRAEVLTIRLPYAEAAFATDRSRRRRRALAMATAMVPAAVVAGLVLVPAVQPLGLVLAAVAVGVAVVLAVRVSWAAVGIKLDASRRWVALSNVHPDFVEAVLDGEDERITRRDAERR